jgi:hypothetical protein
METLGMMLKAFEDKADFPFSVIELRISSATQGGYDFEYDDDKSCMPSFMQPMQTDSEAGTVVNGGEQHRWR